MLLVCSTKRDYSCAQAQYFHDKAAQLNINTQVQPENLSHADINQTLGEKSDYTQAVNIFINTQLEN